MRERRGIERFDGLEVLRGAVLEQGLGDGEVGAFIVDNKVARIDDQSVNRSARRQSSDFNDLRFLEKGSP